MEKGEGRKGEFTIPRVKPIQEDPEVGRLSLVAARILMKVFYAARVARLDLYRAISGLTRHLTRWTEECDRRLHRLMSYVHCTLSHRMAGWIGDQPEDLDLHVYADANFGVTGGKATTGVHMNIEGLHSCFPISAASVAQQAVSHSTP